MSTTDTPETDALIEGNGYHPTEHMWREHARKQERERDEARAEAQRLQAAIESVLPGMRCQQPPKLGAWDWPHAVKTLEQALSSPPNQVSKHDELVHRKIISAHGKEWWAHDGGNQPTHDDHRVSVLFFGGNSDDGLAGDWGWSHVDESDELSGGNIIAWRPADAPNILPKGGGE